MAACPLAMSTPRTVIVFRSRSAWPCEFRIVWAAKAMEASPGANVGKSRIENTNRRSWSISRGSPLVKEESVRQANGRNYTRSGGFGQIKSARKTPENRHFVVFCISQCIATLRFTTFSSFLRFFLKPTWRRRVRPLCRSRCSPRGPRQNSSSRWPQRFGLYRCFP